MQLVSTLLPNEFDKGIRRSETQGHYEVAKRYSLLTGNL
jgi:hypothetical protein